MIPCTVQLPAATSPRPDSHALRQLILCDLQRQTLVPVAEYMRTREPGPAKIIDVAAGTGRFATFIKVWAST